MKKISLITSSYFLNNKIFDVNCRDRVSNRFILLKDILVKKNINIATYDINKQQDSELAIHFDIHPLAFKNKPSLKNILVVSESPIICSENQNSIYRKKFDKILTWESDKVDNIQTFRLGCGSSARMLFDKPNKILFYKKKDLCIICGNKFSNGQNELYSERDSAINFFSKSDLLFDMYGEGWDRRIYKNILRPLNRIPFARKFLFSPHPSYQGAVASKFETLSKYKFSLCFENVKTVNGYISEKIFDSMFSGCIPIYLGAADISNYLPYNTFIDMSKFESYEDLNLFLKNLSHDEYCSYLIAISDYYSTFLTSSFHEKYWAQTIAEHVFQLLKL